MGAFINEHFSEFSIYFPLQFVTVVHSVLFTKKWFESIVYTVYTDEETSCECLFVNPPKNSK